MGSDVEKRLRTYARLQGFLAGVIIVLTITTVGLLAWYAAKTSEQSQNLKTQVTYLCTVARVLDPIVLEASQAVEDPAARAQFRAAHLVLSQTQPCGKVEG